LPEYRFAMNCRQGRPRAHHGWAPSALRPSPTARRRSRRRTSGRRGGGTGAPAAGCARRYYSHAPGLRAPAVRSGGARESAASSGVMAGIVEGARLPARANVLRPAYRSHTSSARRSGAVIASSGGRAGTMVGNCGHLPRRVPPHPQRGRSRRRTTAAGAGKGAARRRSWIRRDGERGQGATRFCPDAP